LRVTSLFGGSCRGKSREVTDENILEITILDVLGQETRQWQGSALRKSGNQRKSAKPQSILHFSKSLRILLEAAGTMVRARAKFRCSAIEMAISASIHAAGIIALIAGIVPNAPAQTPPACIHTALVTNCDHWDRFVRSLVSVGTVASPAATTVFSQVFTSHDGFDGDAAGYGKHYGVDLLGNISGKFFGKLVLPVAFHQDDVYVPTQSGASFGTRVAHVSKHLLITASADHSRSVFNVAAMPNSLLCAAVSNVYQPALQRTAGASATRFAYNVLGFWVGDAYEEFRPEIGKIEAVLIKLLPWHKRTP